MRGKMSGRGAMLGLVVALAAGAPAFGQEEDRFREISPGFGDVNPQMVDGLFRPVDMRAPVGFDRLYEIVGSGGLFARRSGAVTAVFDRSVYAWDSTALVPAGTVYYIGDLPVDLARPGLFAPAVPAEGARGGVPSMFRVESEVVDRRASRGAARGRVDLRVGREGREGGRGIPPRKLPGVSIWTSEEHRQRRVGELIRGAAWRWRASEAAEGR